MNENKIIETLKYISQFVENRHDEGLGDYLHIVIGRADINVIDETIYLLERKQKEIVRYKEEIEEKSTIIMAGAKKVKLLQKEIEEYKKFKKDIVNKIMIWDKEELPDNEAVIEMIDTLMREVSRLEDIEDKKVEVAVDCIEKKRDKFWKDKIRKIINKYINVPGLDDGPIKNLVKELLEEK